MNARGLILVIGRQSVCLSGEYRGRKTFHRSCGRIGTLPGACLAERGCGA